MCIPNHVSRHRRTLAAAACLMLVSCGHDSSGDGNAFTPTATNTAFLTATPTATPTPRTVYDLTEGSWVRLSDGSEQHATGIIVVSPCLSFNTYYAYHVISVVIDTESVAIVSADERGELEAVTIYPEETAVTFFAAVLINGASHDLIGIGPINGDYSGQMLSLELQAAPYALHLEAVRNGPPYSRDGLERCF